MNKYMCVQEPKREHRASLTVTIMIVTADSAKEALEKFAEHIEDKPKFFRRAYVMPLHYDHPYQL